MPLVKYANPEEDDFGIDMSEVVEWCLDHEEEYFMVFLGQDGTFEGRANDLVNDHGTKVSTYVMKGLRVYDPAQYIKFVIYNNGGQCDIHTVNYGAVFEPYVPIDVPPEAKSDKVFLHPRRFFAHVKHASRECRTAVAAEIVEHSLRRYYSIWNIPARVWRWWTV